MKFKTSIVHFFASARSRRLATVIAHKSRCV